MPTHIRHIKAKGSKASKVITVHTKPKPKKPKKIGNMIKGGMLFVMVVFFCLGGTTACSTKNGKIKIIETVQAQTPVSGGTDSTPVVYMTTDISPAGLAAIYESLGRKAAGKVAVKISTGEPGGHHFLSPDLIKDLVQSMDGTIVESNTAGGRRITTAIHKQVAIDHGFTAIAPVDIMDEEGIISIPFANGKNITEDLVGSHFTNYDSFVILSHFKGHVMGGFGGAIKNMSIGIASSQGKSYIHSGGKYRTGIRSDDQNVFLESMAEAAGAVMNHFGENILYISVMNNLSIDCDCMSNPAPPELDDIGILGSLDPIALDKACVDQIYASDTQRSASLRERIESRNGLHTLEHAETLGLGSQRYELVMIDG
jgi:uncharacterized Fe-S center protein